MHTLVLEHVRTWGFFRGLAVMWVAQVAEQRNVVNHRTRSDSMQMLLAIAIWRQHDLVKRTRQLRAATFQYHMLRTQVYTQAFKIDDVLPVEYDDADADRAGRWPGASGYKGLMQWSMTQFSTVCSTAHGRHMHGVNAVAPAVVCRYLWLERSFNGRACCRQIDVLARTGHPVHDCPLQFHRCTRVQSPWMWLSQQHCFCIEAVFRPCRCSALRRPLVSFPACDECSRCRAPSTRPAWSAGACS